MRLFILFLVSALTCVLFGDPDFVEWDAFVDVSVPTVAELYGEVVVDPLGVDDVAGESSLFAEEGTPGAGWTPSGVSFAGALGDVSFELDPGEGSGIRRQSMHSLLSRILRN